MHRRALLVVAISMISLLASSVGRADDFSSFLGGYVARCGANFEDGTLKETSEYFEFSQVANQSDEKSATQVYWNRISAQLSKVEAQHCDEELFFRAGPAGTYSICPRRCPVLEKYECEMIPRTPAKRTPEAFKVRCTVFHPSSAQAPGVAKCSITIPFDIFYRCVSPLVAEGPTIIDVGQEDR
ncbi:MAG: hypothetical protein K1X79_05695 [Oligoflexia bacterium]|nr:hypothetical protein [Oligoflexia bacterium]